MLITDTLCDINGVSRFIQDCVRYAAANEVDFKAICATQKKDCPKDERLIILKPLMKIRMFYYPQLDLVVPPILRLYKLMKQLQPDLVHIPTAGPVGLVGLMIARQLKLPIVGVYHTDFSNYMYNNTKLIMVKKITSIFLKWFYKDHQHLFSRSVDYIDKIEQELALPRKNIHLIQAGVDTQIFSHHYYDRNIWNVFGVEKTHFIALYVGRVTAEKNVQFLYELWHDFIKTHPHASLVLVGYGYDNNKIESYKKENIFHVDVQRGETLSKIYASSDIFLFPSLTDTLGQVVMESIVSGTPVMVSDVGGPKEIVKNCSYDTGYVKSTESTQGWLEEVTKLYNDKITQKRLRDNCIKSRQDFSIEASINQFLERNKTIIEQLET